MHVASRVYCAPEASKNLVNMKSITNKNCTVIFDEDEVVIRNKSTGPGDYQRILWHRRKGHNLNYKFIESDRRGLVRPSESEGDIQLQ